MSQENVDCCSCWGKIKNHGDEVCSCVTLEKSSELRPLTGQALISDFSPLRRSSLLNYSQSYPGGPAASKIRRGPLNSAKESVSSDVEMDLLFSSRRRTTDGNPLQSPASAKRRLLRRYSCLSRVDTKTMAHHEERFIPPRQKMDQLSVVKDYSAIPRLEYR